MKTWKSEKHFIKSEYICGKENLFEEYPPEICRWLAGLCLLEDVPMQYFLPDSRMLPMNGIRFFYMDRMWLRALMDGAVSLGRVTELDRVMDRMMHKGLGDSAAGAFRSRRQQRMHKNHRRLSDDSLKALDGEALLSGFLLRSELVRHWNGIEVKGYEADPAQGGQRLEILRLEKLEDQVLLCIFDGRVERVELLEPAEALHFGTKANDRKIRIRKVRGSDVGKVLGETTVPVEAGGRLNVQALVKELNEKLELPAGETVTSAELALQLICTADMGEIRREEGEQ